jgi:uncharacterized RDD family membrane protein YckC
MTGFGKRPTPGGASSFGKKQTRSYRPAAPRPASGAHMPDFLNSGSGTSHTFSPIVAGAPIFWRRILSRLVDELLCWMILLVPFGSAILSAAGTYIEAPAGSAEETRAAVELFGYSILFYVLSAAYGTIMESSNLQATVGKLMIGGVLVTTDGSKPKVWQTLVRNSVGRLVVNLIPFYAGYAMGIFRKDRRCLHDLMSGTMVCSKVPAASSGYSDVFA